MNKLQRYYIPTSLADHASIATIGGDWCRSTDVSALEAENDKLIAALQECIIQRFYPEKVSEIATDAILDHEQDL